MNGRHTNEEISIIPLITKEQAHTKALKKTMFPLILALALCLSVIPAQAAALWEEPSEPVTREMVATALWEKDGEPVVNYILPFTDVRQEAPAMPRRCAGRRPSVL